MTSVIFTLTAGADSIPVQRIDTLADCVKILENEDFWDVLTGTKPQIDETDPIRQAAELLGALRDTENMPLLVKHIGTITRELLPPKGFKDAFAAAALVRIGAPSIEPVLVEYQNPSGLFMGSYVVTYFQALLPAESSLALISDHIKRFELTITIEQKEQLLRLKNHFEFNKQNRLIFVPGLPALSAFTTSHPLYLARQKSINESLAYLKSSKITTEVNNDIMTAVVKLGDLRAVEAVETLVPILLVKPDTKTKSSDNKIDKKYNAFKDYPVAVALAKIGIPSIWGLLDEIAKNKYNADEYSEVAYKTMTAILPACAIPGFVNEAIKKQKDEIAQLRLYKMYPLMGLPIDSTPQLRPWESTDGLFKTTAKFIFYNAKVKEATLERENGKQTTIEWSALRKEDQEYIRRQIELDQKKLKE